MNRALFSWHETGMNMMMTCVIALIIGGDPIIAVDEDGGNMVFGIAR